MKKTSSFLAYSASVLILCGAGLMLAHPARAQGEMDHSKMQGSAPTQWADPGKAQTNTIVDGMEIRGGKNGMGGGMMPGMNHGGGSGGMDHGGGHGGGMMQKMICGFAEKLDGRLAFLKAELKLTDQQNAAWNSFSEAWRATAQKATAKCEAMSAHMGMNHGEGVIGKLSMMEMHMVDHLEVVRAQKAALEPLFAALDETQKKTANEIFADTMKVGMQMGGMKHGGGMKH